MDERIIFEVKNEFKQYMQKDSKLDWEGWEDIEVFVGESLSDAWVKARPEDSYKFSDGTFKQFVNQANGKWLEKRTPEDSYKIIIGLKSLHTVKEITAVFVHELVHCLNYKRAVKQMDFSQYHAGNEYFNHWSEFCAVIAQVRYEWFSESCITFKQLSAILGIWSADCLEGIMNTENTHEKAYFLTRYIGSSRAVRDLSCELDLHSKAFHIWNMQPYYIYEKYGYVFYVGNEWEAISNCSLDQKPGHDYCDMMKRIANEEV
ncbi:MAG: hypothetical protein ACLU6W_01175 [Lachnospiraceae bacterium]